MNTTRIIALAHQLQSLQPHHEKISRILKDPHGFLTDAGKKHARLCLRHSSQTITNIKAAIAAELGA